MLFLLGRICEMNSVSPNAFTSFLSERTKNYCRPVLDFLTQGTDNPSNAKGKCEKKMKEKEKIKITNLYTDLL